MITINPHATPKATQSPTWKKATHNKHTNSPTFSQQQKRSTTTRMEPARYNPLLGRRLHRPPIIRSSRNRTNTRSSRLQSSHRSTTRLARRLPRLQKTRTTTTLFRNSTRMYGLNGEQIHSQQTTPLTRCLLARRTTRPPTRIPHYYIYTNPQTTLPRNTRHPRRNRSLPQTPHTLRLLEKYTPKKYPLRLRSRHDNLRNGRKTRHSPSPRTRNRTTHQQHKKPATNRLPMSQKPNTRRNNRQRHNTPPTPRLPAQSQTPIRKLSPHRRRIKQNARPKNPPRSQRPLHRSKPTLSHHDHTRTRRIIRPSLHSPTPPKIPRKNHPSLRNDKIQRQHTPRMLRRMRLLHHLGPPRQIHQ